MKKRSISIHSHPTSVALEPEFWAQIDAAARGAGLSVSRLIQNLDDQRLENSPEQGLASYLRVYVLMRLTSDQPH